MPRAVLVVDAVPARRVDGRWTPMTHCEREVKHEVPFFHVAYLMLVCTIRLFSQDVIQIYSKRD